MCRPPVWADHCSRFASVFPRERHVAAGFRALFNGKDLTGWYGWNPHGSAKLTGEKLAANLKQQREDFAKHWTVENAELVGNFAAYGFLADRGGHMELKGTISATGNIPYGVMVTRLGRVAVGPTTSFSCGTGIELCTDSNGVAGTFAGLLVDEPLVSPNGSVIVRDTQ